MIVRCFEGRSMPEVMEQVRQEMGEDAVILHTQQRRSLLWWFRKMPTIRVWAAVATNPQGDVTAEKKRNSKSTLPETDREERIQTSNFTVPVRPPVLPPIKPNNGEASKGTVNFEADNVGEVETIKSTQKRKRKKRNDATPDASDQAATQTRRRRSNRRKAETSNGFSEIAQRVEQQLQLLATSLWGQESVVPQTGALGMLWKCGVDLPTIQRLFSSQPPVPDPKMPTEEWLKTILTEHLPVTGGLSLKTNVAVLVGPTGVGKTTTVAKIAANQLMQQRRRVALVTVDVFRIGAVQQLETYARLMGLPFFVATTPEEARRCILQARQVADLALVDTIGRSPKHAEQIASLWELVAAMNPDEVLLTLPANGNPADLALAADQFSIFCPTSLVVTKLDEATQTGVIVNLVKRLNLPVSYITVGQNVPEDLEVPTSERLAEWALLPIKGQSEVCEHETKGVNGDA
ncbi:MAG: flagellar biosynthesis protein FlhF [Armatimonadota bacterium]|nr:flagellar biosynthesis protein FlhF [Armatimonadota bacterium]MDW8143940.1 flagellar biosynthesis protein FlhF [Armatimonadota bacterium]